MLYAMLTTGALKETFKYKKLYFNIEVNHYATNTFFNAKTHT
jgi:hypothetical protein